ncbi:MAG: hypothetical protein ACLP1D_02705 [Xanthobacteraceae bacterium]
MNNEYRQLVGLLADDRLRWLSNFLADEPQWDRRTMLRLGSWAAGTVGALVIAMLTVHWSQDGRREQLAAADLVRQSQQLQRTAREGQAENRRLASEIETLSSDRDRLYARVTVLEQGLDSVTGAVTRQSLPASLVLLSATVPLTLPPPVIAAPPVMPAHVADSVSQPDADAAPPAQGPRAAPGARAAAAAESQRIPLSSSTVYAPPDPAAPRLVEAGPGAPAVADHREKPQDKIQDKAQEKTPEKVQDKNAEKVAAKPAEPPQNKPQARTEARKDAAPDAKIQVANVAGAPQDITPVVAPATAAAAAPAAEIPVPRTDFGVDLGGANSMDGLRGLWLGLLKADPAPLSPLRPIVVIRERNNGLGMQLRLVAGPLSDAAAAAKICAALAENNRNCETTVFDGQRLALKPEAEPAPPPLPPQHPVARPLPLRKHAAVHPPKHEERAPEPAPPPPPPATTQSTSPSFLQDLLRSH